MTTYRSTEKEMLERDLTVLHGATIVSTYVEDDEWDAWPGLVLEVQGKNGTKFISSVVISQDMEGNGPGVLIGLWDIVNKVRDTELV